MPTRSASDLETEAILRTLTALVEPLAALIPGECEVVLHDLRRLPNSIVAVAGDVTGRQPGDPATDWLLRAAAHGTYTSALGYASHHADGRTLRSSTLIFRRQDDTPVAALCINNDTRSWQVVAELARAMMPWTEMNTEEFPQDVDELAHRLLDQTIAEAGIPIDLMKKQHKLAVVRDLRDRGFFMLRESVETAAQALGVTRFTVYNYLNEIDREDDPDAS